jgi:hypothetical protein
MKYCPPCRFKAKDEDETCSRCGGELRSLGGPSGQQSGGQTRQGAATATSAKSARPAKAAPRSSTATAAAPERKAPAPSPPAPAVEKRSTPKSSAPKPSAAQPAGTPDIQFQLAGLETAVQSTSRRVRLLAALAGVLAIGFVGLLFYLRHSYIMEFAEVDQLEIVRSDLHTGTAMVRFRPLTEGRIQFVRQGGDREETLLEHSSGRSPEGEFKEFHWTGDVDGSWSISIRYRDGSSLVDQDWQSAQTPVEGMGHLAATR